MDRLRTGEPDDLPTFRPRMGGGRRPKDRIGSTSLRNAVFANLRRAPRGTRPHVASRTLGAGARRVVITTASAESLLKALGAELGLGPAINILEGKRRR